MTKHCLTLLAACLLLASCNDIDYDGTTKIVFKRESYRPGWHPDGKRTGKNNDFRWQ